MLFGLPRWLSGKEPICNTGGTKDKGLIPGLGRSPGEGNGGTSSILAWGNFMDRGTWPGYHPWGHKELDMTEHSTAWILMLLIVECNVNINGNLLKKGKKCICILPS